MTQPIDLGAALDAVVASIAAQFPAVNVAAAEDAGNTNLLTPAILVQITDLEPNPDGDSETGQFPCFVRFEANVILGHRTPLVRREVVKAAGALAAFVYENRFDVKWGAATVLSVEPDDFAPGADNFDIWRVDWSHAADLGESLILVDGITPTQILTSWAPEIGVEHEADYKVEVGNV